MACSAVTIYRKPRPPSRIDTIKAVARGINFPVLSSLFPRNKTHCRTKSSTYMSGASHQLGVRHSTSYSPRSFSGLNIPDRPFGPIRIHPATTGTWREGINPPQSTKEHIANVEHIVYSAALANCQRARGSDGGPKGPKN